LYRGVIDAEAEEGKTLDGQAWKEIAFVANPDPFSLDARYHPIGFLGIPQKIPTHEFENNVRCGPKTIWQHRLEGMSVSG